MAKRNASTAPKTLLDLTEKVDVLLLKASGICSLASKYSEIAGQVPDNSLENALWAAREMIDEANRLVSGFHKSTSVAA